MDKLTVDKNWIHFIGIGGVTTGPLAVEFLNRGFAVTGSDRKLYDPIKSFLDKNNIKVIENFSYKNLINENKVPGLVIVGSGISTKNKEFKFVKLHKLNYKHFPQILESNLIVDNSIVVAGTYGKTSITSMLVKIFKEAGIDISFMFGGQLVSGEKTLKLKDKNTKYSIIEGDEYISSTYDEKSKFFYYHPKFLILTAISWDHTDVFKTPKKYRENFQKLIEDIADDGLIFANGEDDNIQQIAKKTKKEFVFYTKKDLYKLQSELKLQLKVLEGFNLENALIASKFAKILKINNKTIKKALENFKGIKRRLEIKYQGKNYVFGKDGGEILVIDDFGSTPEKAKGSLKALSKLFPDRYVITILEPNFGNRTKEALEIFYNVLKKNHSDLLILPKFTNISNDTLLDEVDFFNKLKNIINVKVATKSDDIYKLILPKMKEHKSLVIVFLSSHSIDMKIKNLIKLLK